MQRRGGPCCSAMSLTLGTASGGVSSNAKAFLECPPSTTASTCSGSRFSSPRGASPSPSPSMQNRAVAVATSAAVGAALALQPPQSQTCVLLAGPAGRAQAPESAGAAALRNSLSLRQLVHADPSPGHGAAFAASPPHPPPMVTPTALTAARGEDSDDLGGALCGARVAPGDVLCVRGEGRLAEVGTAGGWFGHVMLVVETPQRISSTSEEARRLSRLWPKDGTKEIWSVRTLESTRCRPGGLHEARLLLRVLPDTRALVLIGEFGEREFELSGETTELWQSPEGLRARLGHALVREVLAEMREQKASWSYATAIRAAVRNAGHFRHSGDKAQLLEEIQACWDSPPICTSVVISFWQRSLCKLARAENGAASNTRSIEPADFVLQWMPLKADRALPGMLLDTMGSHGWTRHATIPSSAPTLLRSPRGPGEAASPPPAPSSSPASPRREEGAVTTLRSSSPSSPPPDRDGTIAFVPDHHSARPTVPARHADYLRASRSAAQLASSPTMMVVQSPRAFAAIRGRSPSLVALPSPRVAAASPQRSPSPGRGVAVPAWAAIQQGSPAKQFQAPAASAAPATPCLWSPRPGFRSPPTRPQTQRVPPAVPEKRAGIQRDDDEDGFARTVPAPEGATVPVPLAWRQLEAATDGKTALTSTIPAVRLPGCSGGSPKEESSAPRWSMAPAADYGKGDIADEVAPAPAPSFAKSERSSVAHGSPAAQAPPPELPSLLAARGRPGGRLAAAAAPPSHWQSCGS